MTTNNLTPERLRARLSYDQTTGFFTRRENHGYGDRFKAGSHIGHVSGKVGKKYVMVQIDGGYYYAHRLAWLYVHGVWPSHCIDHIDGDPTNNRIENLRDVPQKLNCQNVSRARSNSKSGILGVNWDKRLRKYIASITASGKKTHLGVFITADEARAVYLAAKRKLHDGYVS